jgi:hypothetical protein
MKKLVHSLKRIPQAILHPVQYFSEEGDLWLDGMLVSVALALVTAFSKLTWARLAGQPVTLGDAFVSSALNTAMAWTGFFAVYYVVMLVFRKQTNLADLFGAAGSAGLPLVLTTLLSGILWLIGSFVTAPFASNNWVWIQDVLSWLGVVLSWPGLMAFFVFRCRLELKLKWSILLPLLFVAGLMASWLFTL